MAVFRVEKNKGYTVMSNHHLRNKELTLKAKGLLSQMLSLPENWDYTLAGLSHINKESIDAIRTAVLELEKAGYIERSQGRDEKGKMTAYDKDYKYMIIKYAADGSIRLLSKFPINKIMIEDDEKERLEEKLEKIESTKKLYDVKYDPNLKNEKEGMDFEKKIQEERAKKIEKQIIENYENFFKID